MGWKIGKLLRMCLNVVIPENGSKEGRMLKMLVEIELDKPLLRGAKIKLDKEIVWVDFRYELLPTFCFYCGRIWHSERSCDKKLADSKGNCISEDQYGVWLKAQLVKRTLKGEHPATKQGKANT